VEQTGEALVSSPGLFGRTAIRLCILNPTTTAAHVQRVLDIIEQTPIDALDLGDSARAGAVAPRARPRAGMGDEPVRRGGRLLGGPPASRPRTRTGWRPSPDVA